MARAAQAGGLAGGLSPACSWKGASVPSSAVAASVPPALAPPASCQLSLAAARLSATAAHIAQLAATAAAAPLDAFYAALSDDIAAFEAHCSQERLRHETAHVAAIAKVRSAVNLLWPRAQVRPFGSYATGLMRPGSDIDLVVSLPQVRTTKAMPDAPGALEGRNAIPKDTWHASLARCLLHQAWVIADTVRVVPAKVPIVSFATRYTVGGGAPLRLDVSFESALHLGLYTNDFVHAALREHPPLRPLLLVLKHFLARRSLDKPYLGGLSAYGLLLLVLRFLQALDAAPPEGGALRSLGGIFARLLHFYGTVFDPTVTGVAVSCNGRLGEPATRGRSARRVG